jgi:hypothetical protein
MPSRAPMTPTVFKSNQDKITDRNTVMETARETNDESFTADHTST